jgi:hypothetical protein
VWGILVVGSIALGQTLLDLRTQSKSVDFSAASETRPVKTGTQLPATCSSGALFFLSNAPSGQNLYGCVSANTWALQSGGTGGGGTGDLTVSNNDTLVGMRPWVNFVAGSGVLNTISDNGSRINVQQSVDTAVIQTKASAQAGGAVFCASSGGSGTTYTCGLNPTLTGYTTGMVLFWRPDVSNGAGGMTLNVSTLGARSVLLSDGVQNPSAGQFLANRVYILWFDGTNFRFLAGV